jgi:hypothetical protein
VREEERKRRETGLPERRQTKEMDAGKTKASPSLLCPLMKFFVRGHSDTHTHTHTPTHTHIIAPSSWSVVILHGVNCEEEVARKIAPPSRQVL